MNFLSVEAAADKNLIIFKTSGVEAYPTTFFAGLIILMPFKSPVDSYIFISHSTSFTF